MGSKGNILPIFKNKRDSRLPENYRPITLLSDFGKLFTSILNTRINEYFENGDVISHCNTEPRKGHFLSFFLSCAHKLLTRFNNIITHLNDLLCRTHKLFILF